MFVCFMAKSAFFWGGGGFGPSSVERGSTHRGATGPSLSFLFFLFLFFLSVTL